MTPEAADALRRVREFIDACPAHIAVGWSMVLPTGEVLSIADVAAVLEEAEGPHGWAAVVWHPDPEDGGTARVDVLETFLTEQEAEDYVSISFVPKASVARWDDNGHKSCWRSR